MFPLLSVFPKVAGNLIRILFRDYPNTCRIVGVADGFGVAEDPNGLDKDELLRLVAVRSPLCIYYRVLYNVISKHSCHNVQ